MHKSLDQTMYVIKRSGNKEKISFDKITIRLEQLIKNYFTEDESEKLVPELIAQKVIDSIYSGITTELLDLESAKICTFLSTLNPLYSRLAGIILVNNLHKTTTDKFVEKLNNIQEISKNNNSKKLFLDEQYLNFINDNKEKINSLVDYERDYTMDYFGFKTLERAYLLKDLKNKQLFERPQDMWMRVASFINQGNIEEIKKTYDLMSQGFYTHASPTLYNSGTSRSQLSSCFLLGTDDSIEGITDTWKNVSMISKWAGGIGLHCSNIRAKDSIIRGTNGPSSGIIPMLQVYNNIARYINQGGKRKGSFAIYLEPHHPDILAFLDLRKNFGAETERARDLFTALWISDEFMKQVYNDGDWYLMCPDQSPGLTDVYGEEFTKLYWKYVKEGKYKEKVSAKKIMDAIIESQSETGTPYLLFKNACNQKSNQKNIGTIKSSNLCAEILEYSGPSRHYDKDDDDDDEAAVCNLASISIGKCVIPFHNERKWKIYSKDNCNFCKWAKNIMISKKYEFEEIRNADIKQIFNKNDIKYPQILYGDELIGGFNEFFKYIKGRYNYLKLYEVAYTATKNLNRVIDINFYPTKETRKSNMRHRPIGLGIQGVADALVMLGINFDSQESLDFNSKIMETIYFAAIRASCDIAKSRYEKIIKLRTTQFDYRPNIPTYYDKNIDPFKDESSNKIYHELKINKFELNERMGTTTAGSYSTFLGSPMSEGKFQFDLWNVKRDFCDWEFLRKEVIKYGVRNSLVTALMPTASTSQILGNNSCFEFFTNNIYTRRTLAGDFKLVNHHMVNDLISIGEWNEDIKQLILADDGSISRLKNVPDLIKKLYKNIWEIKQIWVLKNALARAPCVDQTQSMNIFMSVPEYEKIFKCHYWSWKNGLKTGMYYLRTKPAKQAIKFTVDPNLLNKYDQDEDDGECEMCSA